MSGDTTRELTHRLAAARDAGDVAAISGLLAEDVVLQPPASVGIPAVHGRDAVAGVLSGAVAKLYMQPDTIGRELLRVVVDGDVSVIKSLLSGRTIEDVDYTNEYVCFYAWKDGLVVRVEEHPDTLRAAQSGIAELIKKGAGAAGPAGPA